MEGFAVVIGDRIREQREASGLSLRQFSAMHGLNPNVLSRIERGQHNITLETMFRLTRALKISPIDLLRDLK